jgi:GNAT superfamily N-acetyltransferase
VLRASTTGEGAFVAHDHSGRLRGAVVPALWELSAQSPLQAFLTRRNGIARHLTLPNPQEQDAEAVAAALLGALSQCWRERRTTGDLIRWPSHDPWIARILLAHGFLLDSVCALHPTGPPGFPVSPIPSAIQIRFARPTDEAVLLSLFEEELCFHEACVPFARNSPGARRGFQGKLAQLWRGETLEQGAPLVLVVEQQSRVVAMAECTLLNVTADDEPGFTPAGRYGCIDHVCVREQVRGQGIGRVLVQAIFDAFASHPPDGYVLWYNPDNPLAEAFWPRLGFVPLWATYQRIQTIV